MLTVVFALVPPACSSRSAAAGSATGCSPCGTARRPAPPSGLDPAATRLAVFGFSAAMAGARRRVSTPAPSASITPSNFDLFQSLPLLLVTVVGGVGIDRRRRVRRRDRSVRCPLVAVAFAVARRTARRCCPGTMGITLGRNPNGVVTDLRQRLEPLLWLDPALLAAGGRRPGHASPGCGALDVLARVVRPRRWCSSSRSSSPGWPSPTEERGGRGRADPLDGRRRARRPGTGWTVAALDRALALAEVSG